MRPLVLVFWGLPINLRCPAPFQKILGSTAAVKSATGISTSFTALLACSIAPPVTLHLNVLLDFLFLVVNIGVHHESIIEAATTAFTCNSQISVVASQDWPVSAQGLRTFAVNTGFGFTPLSRFEFHQGHTSPTLQP